MSRSRKQFNEFITNGTINSDEISYISNQIGVLNASKENYIIAMYSITIMIIGFAVEYKNNGLFLLPYLILIPFQRIIDSKKYNSLKLCAYLAVFSDVSWEKHFDLIEAKCFKPSYAKKTIRRFKLIRVSSLHLGLICSLMCIVSIITNLFTNFFVSIESITILEWILICMAVLAFIFLMYWNKDSLDSSSVREKYVKGINNAINDCESSNKKTETINITTNTVNIVNKQKNNKKKKKHK